LILLALIFLATYILKGGFLEKATEICRTFNIFYGILTFRYKGGVNAQEL
jgi:hypothetical protein